MLTTRSLSSQFGKYDTVEFQLYYKIPREKTGLLLARAELQVSKYQPFLLHDKWIPFIPIPKYDFLWNWPSELETPDRGGEQAPLSFGLGSVHVRFQYTFHPSAGFLKFNGCPSTALPLRLKMGDIVLFRSSTLASHGTKIATRCMVRTP